MTSLDDWRRLISTSFVPLDVESNDRGDFTGALRTHNTGGVGWFWLSASAHTVTHDEVAAAASGDAGLYKLSVIVSGTGLLIQDGREAVLRPGDMSIYDAGLPYTLAFDHDFESLVLMFPRSMIDVPVDAVRSVTAVPVEAGSTLGRIVCPALLAVGSDFDALTRPSSARLTRSLLDLVGTICADEVGSRSDREGIASSRLAKIQHHIEANLGNPSLSPVTIARAQYISTRHLHNLFAETGVGVAEWIRTRRLEKCRRDLSDPYSTHVSIREIGQRWGLTDPAHLSRLFKAEYGVSPREYRSHATAGAHQLLGDAAD
ncbi:hypothetical protein B1790_13305 [Mycobacterium sp. AT1]|nr:hypothetical protein B1790_13305 [Mycobacterium sp. AT1]